MKFVSVVLAVVLLAGPALGQETGAPAPLLDDQEILVRDRYAQVLERNPYQDSAFDRVYESYMLSEGVDAWLAKLPIPEGQEAPIATLVLRGRIFARQLKNREAIEALAEARERGEARPELDRLLGQLYYEEGRDAQAIELLSAALDSVENPEERARLCRILGNVFLRSGKREEAVAAWERLVEASPGDFFALQELAEIYEANRLWEEAAGAYQKIADASADDPYRKCRALQAIGKARVAMEDYAGAIVAFEAGLDLAAPGNWLFEDLKERLVAVYESKGDLDGLATYLTARLEQNPQDLDFQELLAETHQRRGDVAAAEAVLKDVLSRSPDRYSAHEMLIGLYDKAGRIDEEVAIYESLINRFPDASDYLRRLGEAYLQHGKPEEAVATWRRVAGEGAGPEALAQLAEWFERYEFYPEAIETYERAIALRPDREWRLRVANLRFDRGEEAEAVAAWKASVEAEETPAAEIAEVASILTSRGFSTDARALYERAMEAAPDNLDVVLAYARLLVAAEDHEGAAPYFEQLAAQDENEYFKTTGEQGVLDAYAALGTLDAYRLEWEQAVADNPDDIAPRLKLARLYARSGNRMGAVRLYEECAAAAPDNVEMKRRLAEAYRQNRQPAEAIAVLESLMEQDTARAGGYLRELLSLHATSNDKDQAIAAAERLVEMAPGNPEARLELAALYMRYNEPEKGLQQYRNLIQIDSDEPAYYRDFGDALARSDRQGEAGEIFRKMLDLATDNAVRLDAVNRLAAVYMRLGQGDEIIAEFQARVQATPKNLAAYEELAAVHRVTGDLKAALHVIDSAREEVEDQAAYLQVALAAAYDVADYRRVVEIFEELLALSGEPTVYDLERLGQAHARAGNMDRALEVWQELSSAFADDVKAQLAVARALREYGFFEESQPYIEKALTLDPYDYALRFQYAQELMGRGENGEASEQLKRILEIGERPPAADGTIAPPASGGGLGGPGGASWAGNQALFSSRGMFTSSTALSGGLFRTSPTGQVVPLATPLARMPGSPAQGFDAFRGVVLQMQVQMAQQAGDVGGILTAYREKVDADPDNIDARYDFLSVCEFAGQRGPALEAAQALLAMYPDDTDLLWRLLRLQQQERQLDAAAKTAEKLAASEDTATAIQALITLISLHQEREDKAGVDAVVAWMSEEFSENAHAQLQLAYTLQQTGNIEEAETFFERAATIDPKLRVQIDNTLAQLYISRGDTDRAREHYTNVLFAEQDFQAANPIRAGRMPNAQLHLPEYQRRGGRRSGGGNVAALPGANFRVSDHQREQAFNQIVKMTSDEAVLAPIYERVRTEAAAYAGADTPEAEQRAAVFFTMYIAYLRNAGGAEKALEELPALVGKKADSLAVQNLKLYLLEDLGHYEEMAAIYDQMASGTAASPLQLEQARLFLSLAQSQYGDIEARYRAYINAGGSNGFLRMVVAQLEQAGEQERSVRLLEEDLKSSRNPDTLAQLSNVYSRRGDHEKAIEIAREAWQTQAASAGRLGPRMGQYNFMQRELNLQSMGLQQLYPLWSAHEQAGRGAALVQEFEEKLAGQPNSVQLHQVLIGLHCQNRNLDRAQQQMEKLASLRPNDFGLRMQYAGLLESNGEKEAALAILEQAAQERPGGRQAYGGEIIRLYRELNKTEELAAFQERLIEEARTPQQMQELAQGFIQQREYQKAASLLERVVAMEPTNGALLLQVADLYWRDKQNEKSVDSYFDFLNTGALYMNLHSLAQSLGGLVQRADEVGRLDELKTLADTKMAATDPLRRWPLLSARIAEHETRWDDAETVLKGMIDGASDDTAYTLLAEFAEKQGKIDEAIAHVEKIGLGRRAVDYRRLAQLSLKKSDIELAVNYFKKHGEQQGGYQGHYEGVQTLIQADAIDAAEPYFLEMIDTIPTGDWTYRQLVDTVLQEHVQRGRFQPSTIERIFKTENEHTGSFVQRLTSDYNNLPGAALARIKPLAERFTDNEAVQSRHADILVRTEAYEEALAAYEHLLEIAGDKNRYFDRYVELLGSTGRREQQKDALLAHVRSQEIPRGNLIRSTVRNLLESGNEKTLYELRYEVLGRVPESERARIDGEFVRAGMPGDLRAALLARYNTNPNPNNLQEYINHLSGNQRHHDVVEFLDANLSGEGARRLTAEEAILFAPSLIASGRAETAWKLLLDTSKSNEDSYNLIHWMKRIVEDMREYGVSTAGLRTLLDGLYEKESLTLDERIFLAAFEVNLGQGQKAMGLLDLPYNDSRLDDVRQAISQQIAPGVRPEDGPAMNGEMQDEAARTRATLDEARSAIQQKDNPRAIAILDALALRPDQVEYQALRARYYLEAGAYDKAIADCDAILAQAPRLDGVDTVLAEAYAHRGETEKALSAWQSNESRQTDHEARNFARLLVEKNAPDAALSVLNFGTEVLDADPENSALVAEILAKSGREDAIPGEMELRYARAYGDQRRKFEEAYGRFLNSSGLWEKLLAGATDPQRPALAAALLAVAPSIEAGLRPRIADALAGVAWPHIAQDVAYGEVLWRLERREEAKQALEAALPRAKGDRELSSIIRELAAAEAYGAAAAALNTYGKDFPSLLRDRDWVTRILANAADDPNAAPLETHFLETMEAESERQFWRGNLAFARGQNAEAIALFDQLLEQPGLPADRLIAIADLYKNSGQLDSARSTLSRALAEGSSGGSAESAALRLIPLNVEMGDYEAALETYANMLPARQTTAVRARRSLLENPAGLSFATADAFVREHVANAPQSAGVSDLVALRAFLAERDGAAASPLGLDALGVSREEAYEAALWSNLVTAWRIAPPVDTPSWETMNEPLPEGLAAFIRGVEGHEAAVAGWIANDALAVYPSVNLSTIRWADYDGNTSRKSAFALAEIYSPEERKVTLAHGSDDWSRVWVNGEEVLSNAQSRICLVDQDRAEVTLRAGNNRILVHCANISNAWEFTLSIVENGEGLKVALPEVAGQQP